MTTTARGAQRIVASLDETQCWSLLLKEQAGRLAFEAKDRVAIVPLNYVVSGRTLVFRTATDAQLLTEQRLPVSFEIDGWDVHGAWSVVAQGTLRSVTGADTSATEQAGREFAPWAPEEHAPRTTRTELAVTGVTGRKFRRRQWQNSRWYW